MRLLIVASLASLVLALGCAGDEGAQAGDVARNLAAAVKEVDGGVLTDVTCEPRPTELESSTQWRCRCTRREGATSFPATYSVQARSDGRVNTFALTEPRSTAPPPSPDAGIPEGHAVADLRGRRCRAAHAPGSRAWRRCAWYTR